MSRRIALLTSAFAVLIVATGDAAGDSATGKKYAVLVGVKEYNHSSLENLAYTENDAADLAKVLKAGGYDVVLLTGNADGANPPTRANILARTKGVFERCTKIDTVLVGLSGHGQQLEATRESYFCPTDGNPSKPETLVSLTELYRQLDQSGAGVKVLLVDACRNDPSAARSASPGVNGDSASRPPRGVAALFSCSAGQKAFENAELRHGVFFYYVLKGLQGEAKDEDGAVTFDGLAVYVRRQVSRRVPELIGAGAKQSPNLVADLSGESPILLQLRQRIAATAPSGAADRVAATPSAGASRARTVLARKQRADSEGNDDFRAGKKAFEQHDYDGAILALTASIQSDADNALAFTYRAWACMFRFRLQQAEKDCNAALRLSPNLALAYALRGWTYQIGHNAERAVSDSEQAIRCDPNLSFAFAVRAVAKADQKRFAEAFADAETAIGLNPNDPYAVNARGYIHDLQNDRNRAIDDYTAALQLDPKFIIAASNIAYSQFLKENYSQANIENNHAHSIDPNSALPYNLRGRLLLTVGNKYGAIEQFSDAIRLYRGFSNAYCGRGIAYGQLGNGSQAMQDLTEAIRLDPRNAVAYQFRAQGYGMLGNFALAMRDVNESIRLESRNATAYNLRGQIYKAQRNYQQAAADFARANELNRR